jgi:hypothetical protein
MLLVILMVPPFTDAGRVPKTMTAVDGEAEFPANVT